MKESVADVCRAIRSIRVVTNRVKEANAEELCHDFTGIAFKLGKTVEDFSLFISTLANQLVEDFSLFILTLANQLHVLNARRPRPVRSRTAMVVSFSPRGSHSSRTVMAEGPNLIPEITGVVAATDYRADAVTTTATRTKRRWPPRLCQTTCPTTTPNLAIGLRSAARRSTMSRHRLTSLMVRKKTMAFCLRTWSSSTTCWPPSALAASKRHITVNDRGSWRIWVRSMNVTTNARSWTLARQTC